MRNATIILVALSALVANIVNTVQADKIQKLQGEVVCLVHHHKDCS